MTIPTDVLVLGLLLLVVLALSLGFAAGSIYEGCRRGGSLDLLGQLANLETRLARGTHRYPAMDRRSLVDTYPSQVTVRRVPRQSAGR